MKLLRPITGYVLLLLMLAGRTGAAEPYRVLTVAAAADLNFALRDIAARFEKQTGQHLRLSFGSSGNIFMQAQNGAPYDVFFSADMDYPRRLEAAGLSEPGTLTCYAVGRLALWIPANSRIPLERLGMNALLDPSVQRIAVANPQHAPYGRAAVEALRHIGLYDRLASKLVFGENVSQAAQFVESGNAQVGIIALSLVLAPSIKGRYWEIPADSYPALEQGAVVLKSSRNRQLARRFMEFVKTSEAAAILQRYGFALPCPQSRAAAARNGSEKSLGAR